nr:hypothetical protein [Xanthobacter flavus]
MRRDEAQQAIEGHGGRGVSQRIRNHRDRRGEIIAKGPRLVPVDEAARLLQRTKTPIDDPGDGVRTFLPRQRRRDQLAERRAALRFVQHKPRQLFGTQGRQCLYGKCWLSRHGEDFRLCSTRRICPDLRRMSTTTGSNESASLDA